MGAYTSGARNLVGAGEPIRVSGESLTPDVLPLLGVRPLIGRVLRLHERIREDEQTAVIGYGLWQSQFGGDPDVVGKTISLDGTPHVVIGVMPSHFRWPREDVQLYTPLLLREAHFENRNNTYSRGSRASSRGSRSSRRARRSRRSPIG